MHVIRAEHLASNCCKLRIKTMITCASDLSRFVLLVAFTQIVVSFTHPTKMSSFPLLLSRQTASRNFIIACRAWTSHSKPIQSAFFHYTIEFLSLSISHIPRAILLFTLISKTTTPEKNIPRFADKRELREMFECGGNGENLATSLGEFSIPRRDTRKARNRSTPMYRLMLVARKKTKPLKQILILLARSFCAPRPMSIIVVRLASSLVRKSNWTRRRAI